MKNSLLSKNYILVIISSTLYYASAYMINAVSSQYSVSLGATKSVAGVVAAVFTLASFFVRPFSGWITDRKGRRLVLVRGLLLSLIAGVFLLTGQSVFMLRLARVIFGAGYSAFTTSAGTMVCDVVPYEKIGVAISVYGVTGVIAGALAPGIGLWLYSRGFIWVSVVTTGLTVLSLLISFFIKYSENKYTDINKQFRIVEKTALPRAYTIVFFAMSSAAVNSFVPLMAEEREINTPGVFFAVSSLFMLAVRFTCTKLISGNRKNKVFYLADIIYVAGFIILAFSYSTLWFLVAATLYGIGAALIHPIVNTTAVSRCTAENRGLATGTFMMSQDLGMTIGALLWGAISEKRGFTAVYLTVSAFLLVMMVVFKSVLSRLTD